MPNVAAATGSTRNCEMAGEQNVGFLLAGDVHEMIDAADLDPARVAAFGS
jgi:hypothetical protein